MNNNDLKAIIAKFGDRLNYIMLDNSEYILLQYPSNLRDANNQPINQPIKPSDIIFEQIGSEDFFSVPLTDTMGTTPFGWRKWHRTDCIQAFGVVDEGCEDFRVFPRNFIR